MIQFGDSVVLECTVYGDSSIGIDWTFDGSSYTSSVEDSSYDSAMYCLKSNVTLSSVDDIDDGNYTCAHSQDSSLDFDFTVDVYSKCKFHLDTIFKKWSSLSQAYKIILFFRCFHG